jgi:hypothetical protein
MPAIEFFIHGEPATIEIHDLVIAGWTGRDAATVEHHIADWRPSESRAPEVSPAFIAWVRTC